jgi:hypothetical protein
MAKNPYKLSETSRAATLEAARVACVADPSDKAKCAAYYAELKLALKETKAPFQLP